MGEYRHSRNIEASIIQYIEDNLSSSWSSVNVEKTFRRVYSLSLPTICVRCGTTEHTKAEIGGYATVRYPQIFLDLFCENDGQRLDLKDFLISILKAGIPYYEYTISGGVIDTKTENGRIRVLSIEDTPINFDIEKDKLDQHDKYRHLLTLNISLGRVES